MRLAATCKRGATPVGLRQLVHFVEATRWIVASGESDAAGGAAILVPHRLCRRPSEVTDIVYGRVLMARIAESDEAAALACVHNNEMGHHDMKRIAMALYSLAAAHIESPCRQRAVLMGDINFTRRRAGRAEWRGGGWTGSSRARSLGGWSRPCLAPHTLQRPM